MARSASSLRVGAAPPGRASVRVILAVGHLLLREGLERILERGDQFEIVGTGSSDAALADDIAELRPDVFVISSALPPGWSDEGVRLAARIRRERPEIGCVLLGNSVRPAHFLSFVANGVAGCAYLLLDRIDDPAEIVHAVRTVATGGSVVDPVVVEGLAASPDESARMARLTVRELDVLELIAEGESNAAIAAAPRHDDAGRREAHQRDLRPPRHRYGTEREPTRRGYACLPARDRSSRPFRVTRRPRARESMHPMDERAPAVSEATETAPPRSGRGRVWGVRGLVVLGSILLTAGALALWVGRVALDTPNWTDTSAKVLQDPEVQQTLSTYLVDQLYTNVDIAGELRDALPPRAKPLAAPAAAGLRNVLVESAQRVFASPQAQQAWRLANERASRQLNRLLDDGDGALTTTNGEIVLDLRPLVSRISGNSAITSRVGPLPADAGRIVLLRSSQLKAAQTGAKALKAVEALLLPLVVLIFGLAIWLARDRRRALRACAIGVVVSGLVLIFVRRVLGDQLIERLVKNDSYRPAVHNTWWIATEQLGLAITSIMFVGVVTLVGTWLAGSGRRAVSLRQWLAPSLRDSRCWLAVAAIILLLLAWAPTPAARNWITVLILVVLTVIGFEALRRQTAREFPPGEVADTPALPRIWGRGQAEPVVSADDARLDRLGRVAQLHADGVLSDEEFSSEKARILEEARA